MIISENRLDGYNESLIRSVAGSKAVLISLACDDDRVKARRVAIAKLIMLHRTSSLDGSFFIAVGRIAADAIQLDEDEELEWLNPVRFQPLRGVEALGVVVPVPTDRWWLSKSSASAIEAFTVLFGVLKK